MHMLSSVQAFTHIVWDKFCYISRPSPKYMKDKEEFELNHSRNKALLLVNIMANTSFIMNLILGNGEAVANINGVIAATFIMTALIVTLRLNLHPQVFKVIFTMYALSFEFLLIINGDEGIIGTGLSAPIIPIFVYLLTGSIGHYLFNIGVGVLFINTFCEDIMEKNLTYLSVKDTTKAFIYYSNQNIGYSFFYTALIHYTINRVLYKIKVVEEKKDDFEKQKNFLLGFSHELRNLINSLMGNVKLASLENLSEKVKDLLLNAEVCAELLLHLVNNILDTGKVEIGELEINPTPTRIYDTIERIWSICSELIKRKNLRGKIKIQKDIPQMLTLDHYRITQVFLNLVGNAVKYTDTGSIDISVEWLRDTDTVKEGCFKPYPFNDSDEQDEGLFEKQQALAVLDDDFIFLNFSRKKIERNALPTRTSSRKGVLKISVTDTGCGIYGEDLNRLFQRFTQGNSDPSKKKLGTGLGLFITKELCQKMGGDVKVYSRRNTGSTFIVCLPIQPVTDEMAFSFDLEGIEKVINNRYKLRAMIVDDERLSHFILRDFLTKMHVDVVDIAENGLVAYQRYMDRERRKDYVNIVTMDLTMPVMDGKTAAQKIREIEATRNMPPCLLIIISGNCSDSEIKECLDKNGSIRANAFVKKPVSIDELCRIISCHFAQAYDQERVRLLNDNL